MGRRLPDGDTRTRGSDTEAQVTQYHVTLNGQGYMLDLTQYSKRPRPPFAGKTASGLVSVDDLRGPELLLRVTDWSGGEGETQWSSGSKRYRSGAGVDVFSVPGAVQLGPNATLVQATADNDLSPMQVYAGKLYVGSSAINMYSWDGATWTAINFGGPIKSFEVFENRLYVGWTGNSIFPWNGAAFGAGVVTAGPAYLLRTHYRQAAQYLYLGAEGAGVNAVGRMYYYDGAAVSAGQYDPEEARPALGFVLNQRLYFVAYESASQRWGLYSVDDQTGGGVYRVHVRGVGLPVSGAVLGSVAYIGDSVAGRIYTWDGSELKVLRDLSIVGSTYGGSLRGLAAWRSALWVGVQQAGGGLAVLRYDPASGSWSRPVSGLTGTDVASLGVFGDQLYVGTSQAGAARVYRVNPSQFGSSGQLETGLIDAGLPGVAKLLRSVTIVTSALVSPQSVQVEYRLEDTGGWTSLGTLSSVGATTATYAFPANTTGRQVAFRVTLSGTAGATSSPTLYELVVRYVPRPALAREWELAVVLEGTAELPMVTLDGASEPLTGAALTPALWSTAASAAPVMFVDLDGTSYQVYVDDLREEMGRLSQRRGYQRLGLVKLVEAA